MGGLLHLVQRGGEWAGWDPAQSPPRCTVAMGTIFGEVSYTSWTLSTGFGSKFASKCSDVCTRWLLNTYLLPTRLQHLWTRRHIRSADRGHIYFLCVKLASYGGRSFAYAGPLNWNSLPAYLRDSSFSVSSFKRHLKTFLFSFY